jgi:hypothetical protein
MSQRLKCLDQVSDYQIVEENYVPYCSMCGLGSSVGIATELLGGRSGDRNPVGRDFPPVQTGPGAHPTSCTMVTGSFPGVKYAGTCC